MSDRNAMSDGRGGAAPVALDAMPDVGAIYLRAVGQLVPAPRGLGWAVRRRPRPDTLPSTVLAVADVPVDRDQLAAYGRVCGFPLRDTLPATYPHVMAFPLTMALLAADDFPFPMVGLVHVANRIEVRRALPAGASWRLTAATAALRPHRRGRQFDVVVEAADDGGVAWRGVSTYLRVTGGPAEEPREGGRANDRPHGGPANDPRDGSRANDPPHGGPANDPRDGSRANDPPHGGRADDPRERSRVHESRDDRPVQAPAVARWRVSADVGGAYARVSGDRNPIHTSTVGARLFGFRRPIAHGMWTKARCLAALDSRLPEAYAVDVAFHAPVYLGSTVEFGAAAGDGWRISVAAADGARTHLTGRVAAVDLPREQEPTRA